MEASTLSAAPTASNAFRRGTVFCLRGWQWLVFWPIALALDFYYWTLRFTASPEDRARLKTVKESHLIMAWHNHSLVFPALWRAFGGPPVTCLISASKMAAWEAAYFEHRGLCSIRGSSTRRSIQATREMVRTVRDGGILGVAPDGPSGPIHEVKRGTVMIARQCNVPIVLLCAQTRQAWRLKTWDRHLIPWPFARIQVRVKIIPSLREMNFASDDEAAAYLRDAVLAMEQR